MGKRILWVGLTTIFFFGSLLSDDGAAAPLDEIIREAKKEGTVSVTLFPGLTAKSMERLEKEIKEKHGVDLTIKFTPNLSMPKDLANAIMEHKTGAVPSYDLMNFGPEHVITGLKAGIFEKVDWRALLSKDTSPEVIVNLSPYGGVGLSCYTSQQGLVYNPKRVSVDEVPKTLGDLARSKWKGTVGVFNYTASWATRAKIMGKDKTLSDLRAILKNGAIRAIYADLYNRYLLGEISMAFMGNSFYKMAQDKHVPAAWQNIDFVDEESRPLVVPKGARHPGAAKLLAIYLGSPGGAKFMLEESGAGNACYPGNFTYDIRMQGKEQGMKIISRDDLMDFYTSEDFAKWQKEIKLILDEP